MPPGQIVVCEGHSASGSASVLPSHVLGQETTLMPHQWSRPTFAACLTPGFGTASTLVRKRTLPQPLDDFDVPTAHRDAGSEYF
jgi:hypothetical protein